MDKKYISGGINAKLSNLWELDLIINFSTKEYW
jgi:hypothetical protein